MDVERFLESLRVVVEPLLALAFATLLTFLLVAPYLPEGAADLTAILHEDPRALRYLLGVQSIVFLACGALLARWRIRQPARPRSSPWRAVLAGVGAAVAALVASTVISLLLGALGLPVEEQAWLEQLFRNPAGVLLMAPWIVLVGPLAEEAFFRAYAYRFIAERAGIPVGTVVSSVLFAAIHRNVSGFLVYLAIGCILAWVYERTGRFAAAFVGHAALNAVVLTASVLVDRI
jgi:membrane protease YdiL (CAAX protease family)